MDIASELVSVIVPTYNRYESLMQAVLSITRQTHPAIEIVVIDDGSTDERYRHIHDDLKVICRNTSCSLVLIVLPINLRKIHNTTTHRAPCQGLVRNEGIKVARGKWIAFLDDDDKWISPNKLTIQLITMKEMGMKFSMTNMAYKDGVHHVTPPPRIVKRADAEHGNPIACSTVVIDKDLIIQAGLFRHVVFEDYDCWKRVLELSDCLYIDLVTTFYETTSYKYYVTNT